VVVCVIAVLWSIPVAAQSPPAPEADEVMTLTMGERKLQFGVDFAFAGVYDNSQVPTIGRERQIKVAYVNLSVAMEVNNFLSFSVTVNPAQDGIVPKPYIPSDADRRGYFFPNGPEGRGVVSDPHGIKDVDDYKYSGFDPIIQQGSLRVGYVDVHSRGRTLGATIGATTCHSFALDELTWFTAKDMTHIQRINAQADNGLFLYYNTPRFRVDVAAISGNGNPYHDYGYFDFTTPTADNNSALGAVASARYRTEKFVAGGTYRKNFINSRVEDSISLQLSKHNDDAVIGFASFRPNSYVRVYGEVSSYKWGLAKTSADLLPGPPVESPVYKAGFYAAVDALGPTTNYGQWGVTASYEDLSRDDSLVAFAAARHMFGVTLGEREKGTIF
jgi:hypothetical protein